VSDKAKIATASVTLSIGGAIAVNGAEIRL
jgi:hypothetical protein